MEIVVLCSQIKKYMIQSKSSLSTLVSLSMLKKEKILNYTRNDLLAKKTAPQKRRPNRKYAAWFEAFSVSMPIIVYCDKGKAIR